MKGERLRPFSSKLGKERIQSVQLVINLLGQLTGQVEKNIKLVKLYNPVSGREQSIQPHVRKRREKICQTNHKLKVCLIR